MHETGSGRERAIAPSPGIALRTLAAGHRGREPPACGPCGGGGWTRSFPRPDRGGGVPRRIRRWRVTAWSTRRSANLLNTDIHALAIEALRPPPDSVRTNWRDRAVKAKLPPRARRPYRPEAASFVVEDPNDSILQCTVDPRVHRGSDRHTARGLRQGTAGGGTAPRRPTRPARHRWPPSTARPFHARPYDDYLKSLLQGKARSRPDRRAEKPGARSADHHAALAAQAEKDGLEKDPDVTTRIALLRMRVLADAESRRST